jgi:hypothetical protein
VSYCLITVLVPIVETSSLILLFCQTLHWQSDLLFVGWCSVYSCAEWCQCKVQSYDFSHDPKAEEMSYFKSYMFFSIWQQPSQVNFHVIVENMYILIPYHSIDL